MKKIFTLLLAVMLALNTVGVAHAAPTAQGLANACGLPGTCTTQILTIATSTGTLLPAADNTYDVGSASLGYRSGYFDTSVLSPLIIPPAALTLRLAADAQRLMTFTGTSDTDINVSWGDAGVTAVQDFSLIASTADADDDSRLNLCGGGAVSSTRGACLALSGNEDSVSGDASVTTGAEAGSSFFVKLFASGGTFQINNSSDVAMWDVSEATGVLRNLTGGGDIGLSLTGTTLRIQEATAASKCMGTATANGVTAVPVATTCVETTSRIFISRTSAVAAGVTEPGCWATNIVNDTSFDLDCNDAAEDSTFNWIIINEAA